MELLALITALAGIAITITWIVIGWRAMRAHERIADAASEWIYQQRSNRHVTPQKTYPPER